MGWSLLGACVEPTQEPGNSTLFWVLLGCRLGSRCVPARGPSRDPDSDSQVSCFTLTGAHMASLH